MTSVALALAIAASTAPAGASLPVQAWSGRIIDSEAIHVGLRPAAFLDNEDHGRLEVGLGATIQVTARVF